MIDIDITVAVSDDTRRFDLTAAFRTDAAFVALYGPSGSGKSLTLQAIAGLLKPSAGHVRLNGRTLFDSTAGVNLPPPARRIGYLFQDYALFPHLNVRQNVAFGLVNRPWARLKHADRDRVDDLLERFGLAPLAESRPRALSGGQRQRVALARALACEPLALLLDEPFAALNPMLRDALREDLAAVRRQWGIPALMITHDAEDVLALADVAYVYRHGGVVREVDLRRDEARELAARALDASIAAPTPRRRRLLGWLEGAPLA